MKYLRTLMTLLLIGMGCMGLLTSCEDDDDDYDPLSEAISDTDPSYGFLLNATSYRLQIDLGEVEEFKIVLNPGQLKLARLDPDRTYILHVLVLDTAGRVVSEYVNTFYIDNIPLDNQLRDFLCSWFVEFTPNNPLYGFANNFGS